MTNHRPNYYISTGALNRMYTLWFKGIKRDGFITNLSTDPKEAVQKAKDIISQEHPDWCAKMD